jgi:phosphatidylserine decarboxylase
MIVRDAYVFIIPLGVVAVLGGVLGVAVEQGYFVWGGGVFLLLALFVAFFFRDPERVPPAGEGLVVSPADGRVVLVEPLDRQNPDAGTLVSIFLSVFDVHVNRSPIAGQITGVEYREGKFRIATDARASVENEQNIVTVENGQLKVIFKQIAGVLARRIVFWKQAGDHLQLGERVGLIKFGSRTDVILPPEVEVSVRQGERVKGGVSIIGRVRR